MAWRRAKPAATPSRRPARHGRHGRTGRSPIVRPPLPPIDTRIERFDLAVGAAAEFLRSAWDELRDVSFEIGDMPGESGELGIPRWTVDTTRRRIIVWRLPIERLSHLHRDDDLHRRMMIESCVFRAAAEYLGMDPWDLGPERFRYF
ncbi:metallopeptidase family protein [Microbacterium aquimaris]|uniref:Metallopeptidase family protein n=1 Tax=Microbacterium aquimaris TaxID=459816 RepID=A0ABU5N677_9MICO|nr:metallopeptidase family protein [Microbacterium aquimaris]MDZ8161564.1 metallopeptidase family protein [Microbacterium aquimaris]